MTAGVSYSGEFFSFTSLCSFPKPWNTATLPVGSRVRTCMSTPILDTLRLLLAGFPTIKPPALADSQQPPRALGGQHGEELPRRRLGRPLAGAAGGGWLASTFASHRSS